jgi:predicted exporter
VRDGTATVLSVLVKVNLLLRAVNNEFFVIEASTNDIVYIAVGCLLGVLIFSVFRSRRPHLLAIVNILSGLYLRGLSCRIISCSMIVSWRIVSVIVGI